MTIHAPWKLETHESSVVADAGPYPDRTYPYVHRVWEVRDANGRFICSGLYSEYDEIEELEKASLIAKAANSLTPPPTT